MIYTDIDDTLLTEVVNAVGGCNLQNGPWIAGGTARRLWHRLPWIDHDVDVFFPNVKSWQDAHRTMDILVGKQASELAHNSPKNLSVFGLEYKEWCPSKHVTTNATTFNVKILNIKLRIQLIYRQYYKDLQDLWATFDFTVCKFATDGHVVAADLAAINHCDQNRLSMNPHCQQKLSARRVIKYSLHGFNADYDTIAELLKQRREMTLTDYGDDTYA